MNSFLVSWGTKPTTQHTMPGASYSGATTHLGVAQVRFNNMIGMAGAGPLDSLRFMFVGPPQVTRIGNKFTEQSPEKFIVAQLVDTFPNFSGIRRLKTVFTTARHRTPSRGRWKPIHNLTPYFFKIHLNIILPFLPRSLKVISTWKLVSFLAFVPFLPQRWC
jgi:hypothetical protein